MKILQSLYLFAFLFTFAGPPLQAEDRVPESNPDVNYGPWPIDQFYSTAARYYQSLGNKSFETNVITLNDPNDLITEAPKISSESNKDEGKPVKANTRWGNKSISVVPIYQVVEHGDSEFKRDFKEIFGKSVKYYQAVCATYENSDKVDKDVLRVLDPSGIFALGTFSKIDLWLMDETGKCYVVLSYEVARGFKGNMRAKVLENLGIHDAKLWK